MVYQTTWTRKCHDRKSTVICHQFTIVDDKRKCHVQIDKVILTEDLIYT